MSDTVETLPGLLAHGWDLLEARGEALRNLAFATVGPQGWPEVRTVVLRGADREAGTLEVHTDRYSSKITSLRDAPMAETLAWDAEARVQIRARAEVFIQTGLSVAEAWAQVPDPSREAYGAVPAPGTPIDDALAYEKPGRFEGFAVLHCRVVALDLVHLGEVHRRARYRREDDWQGQWLAP